MLGQVKGKLGEDVRRLPHRLDGQGAGRAADAVCIPIEIVGQRHQPVGLLIVAGRHAGEAGGLQRGDGDGGGTDAVAELGHETREEALAGGCHLYGHRGASPLWAGSAGAGGGQSWAASSSCRSAH